MFSTSEENYLKALFVLSEKNGGTAVSTNAIAARMQTAAASATDMMKRLAKGGWVKHEPYKGSSLTKKGGVVARNLIRRHRVWETFLYDQLHFSWDEVHDLAEQLEHIQSDELVNRLEHLLGYPKFDPHGDPIPNKAGEITRRPQCPISELAVGDKGFIVGVGEHSSSFLSHLGELGLVLGVAVEVLEKRAFDQSMIIQGPGKTLTISHKVACNIMVNKS